MISNQLNYSEKSDGYFDTPRPEMLEFIPDKIHSALEIGCGTGAFGALVKRMRHCRYTGVEINEAAAKIARSRLDSVLIANIEEASLPLTEKSFDCLICNDVLEHLVDPWATLKNLTKFLAPSGHLVISLPNVRFSEVIKDLIFRKRWDYKDEGVLDRTHLRFFTEKSARDLIEYGGFEILKFQGINPIKYAWRLKALNAILFGALADMQHPQFGTLSRLK